MRNNQSIQTIRLFSPIFPEIYYKLDSEYDEDNEDYEDYGNSEYNSYAIPLSSYEVLEYHNEILKKLENYNELEENEEKEHGLALYLSSDLLKEKVHYLMPYTIEEWNNQLYCVTKVQLYSSLSDCEMKELIEELTAQFSDGWGEGFEQQLIEVEEGELYISTWDSSDEFFIKVESDLKGINIKSN